MLQYHLALALALGLALVYMCLFPHVHRQKMILRKFLNTLGQFLNSKLGLPLGLGMGMGMRCFGLCYD